MYLSTGWLQGTDANVNADKSAWTSSSSTRYFYSDEMISSKYKSQIRAQFHLDSNNKVDSVRVVAVKDVQTDGKFTPITGLDRTYDSKGAHATN